MERLDLFVSKPIAKVFFVISVNQTAYATACESLSRRGIGCTVIRYSSLNFANLETNFDVSTIKTTERAMVVFDDVCYFRRLSIIRLCIEKFHTDQLW